MWNYEHVRHWIHWAVKKFTLRGVDVANFNLTGQELIALTHEQFVNYIPCDYHDVFWTHLELLRKCKFIGTGFQVYLLFHSTYLFVHIQ
jgi:GA-binding protein transcription factor, alpha